MSLSKSFLFGFFKFVSRLTPLSAKKNVWMYPSSKWSSQWPYDGYIRHAWMISCGSGRDTATLECFGRGSRSRGTIFVRISNISLFFQSYVHFEEFFCSRALLRLGAKRSSAGAFGFDDVLELFLKLRSDIGHLLRDSTTTSSIFLKITFRFSTVREIPRSRYSHATT